ncbi:ORF52 [Ictalurid herpesvirus 1]|nr:ORF52 [Ictalurid herpesvirus 1]
MLIINQESVLYNIRDIFRACTIDEEWNYLIRGNIIYSPLLDWDIATENEQHSSVLLLATPAREKSFVRLLEKASDHNPDIRNRLGSLRAFTESCVSQPIFNIFTLFNAMIPLESCKKLVLFLRQLQILQRYFGIKKSTVGFESVSLEPDAAGVPLPPEFIDAAVAVQIPPHKTTPWFFGVVPMGMCRWKEGVSKREVVSF